MTMSTPTEAISGTPEELLSFSENGKQSPASSTENDRVQLKKRLRLIDAIGIMVGIIVGSGIFISPKGVLQHAGSPGLGIVVWILSGLLSTIGALCYAELGTMIPKSGGDYAYLNEAFGPSLAFLYMWSAFAVIMPAGNAVIAITCAQYLLQPLWPGCQVPYLAVRLIAAVLTCFLTWLNCYDVKWVAKVQDAFSFGKVLALGVIVVCGVIAFFDPKYDNLSDPFYGSYTEPGRIALSFYSGIFSFAGWNYLNFVTEEIKNPYKNLPRAIMISLPVVTVIYVLVNCAYFVVLSKTDILSSDAVAVTFGDKMLGRFNWIIPLFVVLSTFGSLNGNIFASSRLYFVGAQNGHLPGALSLLNVNSFTPIPSLIFLCIFTLLLLLIEDVFALINYATFVESLFTLCSISGLLWMRYKEPELKRPIKVSLALPVLFFIVCTFLVTTPFFVEPWQVGVGFLIIISGIPVYRIFVHKQKKISWLDGLSSDFNSCCAKLFLSAQEEGKYD